MATRPNTATRSRPGSRIKLLALSVAMACSPTVLANPSGALVVNGAANIAAAGNTLTITNSAGAIINWQSFSIGSNEVTRFVQPSASSSVLNRVVANDPSVLLGQLSSNGKVFLINPAGILVGAGARIDTAGFVASTLNLANSDFLAGRLNFVGDDGAKGVTNRGEIVTPAGGSVYLIGANVANEGIIRTPGGETLLAAGQSVRLIDTATPGVSVEITGASGQATNLGEISAEAGRVGITGALIRQSGTVSASSVVREGGRIFLKAVQRVDMDGGKLDVSSTAGKGGRVEITGDEVALTGNAMVDASGATGGGQILVGGGYRGGERSVANAGSTLVESGVSLKADATGDGDGGLVVAWATGQTTAKGSLSARGGAFGGNGGVIETSGHTVDFAGVRIDAGSPKGKSGFWLIDPYDLVIDSSSASTISTALNTTTDVLVEASGSSCSGPGGMTCSGSDLNGNGFADIFIQSPIQRTATSGSSTLTMTAEGNIEFSDALGNSPGISASTGVLNVVLNAGRSIVGNPWGMPSDIATTGTVTLNASTGIGGGGMPFVVDASTVSFNNATSGTVYLHSLYANPITIDGSNAGTSGTIIRAYNGLIIPATGLSSGGDIQLSATTVDIGGTVSAPGKTIYAGPYSANPVSIEGASAFDVSSAEIAKLSAGKVVIGDDGFGNRATSVSIGGASPLTIPAGQAVEVRSGGGIDWVSGTADTINGRLDLNAAGTVTLNRLIQSTVANSSLYIRAGGNVALNQNISLGTGGILDVRSAGNVTYAGSLEARAGIVDLRGGWDIVSDILSASGTNGVTGGASSLIVVDGISPSTPAGGTIRLAGHTVRGDGVLSAKGGDSIMDSLGGTGGSILLQGDSITLGASAIVSALGGKGGNYALGSNGGSGGLVRLDAAGPLALEAGATVMANGGAPGGGGHAGGQGGTIELLATGNLAINGSGDPNLTQVVARGGECVLDCISGPGGAGGVVIVRGGSVTLGGSIDAGGGGSNYADAVTGQGAAGGAAGSVNLTSTAGSLAIDAAGEVEAQGGNGAAGGPGGNGGNGGVGGPIVLVGASGISNSGTISASGGMAGGGGGTGAAGIAGMADTVTFRSAAGGVSQTSGHLEGRIRLGDAAGVVAGNVNIADSGNGILGWEGIVGGTVSLSQSAGQLLIGSGGLKAAAMTLEALQVVAASQTGTALDTSGANGNIRIVSGSLGGYLAPVSMKSGNGLVKLDVSGDVNARFDEALDSGKLSVCEPPCAGTAGRTVRFETAPGFGMTVVPKATATGFAPYDLGGDHLILVSGENLIFSGEQAGFTNGGSIALKAVGGIYAPGVAAALDTSAYGGTIELLAREIGGPSQGLTVNPGSGTVTARVTNGGMHLVHTVGDLSTSRYILTNDAVGSNTHLTALTGDILVDGVAGFGTTTRDDGLYLSASLGNIQQSAGAPLVANGLYATAKLGISLTAANQLGEFTALNTTSGDISLLNTGNPLVLGGDGVTGLANLKNQGGNITVNNTGALVSDGSIEATGTVTLSAHSPITLNGAVAGSGVSLVAASSAAGNDNLHINSSVTAGSGGISAVAGTDIVMAPTATLTTDGGDVNLTAGQDIVLGQIGAGTGTVTMTASAGSVTTAAGAPLPTVSAQGLVIRAATGVEIPLIKVQMADIDSTTGPLSVGVSLPGQDSATNSAIATVVAATNSSTNTSSSSGGSTNQTTTSSGTTGGTLLSSSSSGGSTIGGGSGEFGGSEGGSGQGGSNGDKKDKDQKASDGGDQKGESKNAPKKNAQCTS